MKITDNGLIAIDRFISRYYTDLRFGTLQNALSEYCDYIENNLSQFSINDSITFITSLKAANKSIIEAEELFLSGLIGDCYDKIYRLIFDEHNIEDLGLVWEIDNDVIFFRMRSVDSQFLLSPNELNHIPFNKRDCISNQRFSLSGFPCLYLGSSIYVCWEELMRPNINTANIAAFLTKKPIKLINFDYWRIEAISDEQLIYRTLFKIATSMTRKEAKSTHFKQEYIIPQAILHSIIKWNRNHNIHYDGIAYLSTRYGKEGMLYDDAHRYLNVVIPSIPNSRTNSATTSETYCKHISELFEERGPISLSIFNIIRPDNCFIPDGDTVENDQYLDSELYKLESYLRKEYRYTKYFWTRTNHCRRIYSSFNDNME